MNRSSAATNKQRGITDHVNHCIVVIGDGLLGFVIRDWLLGMGYWGWGSWGCDLRDGLWGGL